MSMSGKVAMNPVRHSQRKQRGQSMVETALFFTILITILTGVVEVAVAVNAYLKVINAAREGARYAASRFDTTDVTASMAATADWVKTTASPLSLTSSNATIIVTYVTTLTANGSVTITGYQVYTDPNLGSDASHFTSTEIQNRLNQAGTGVNGEDKLIIVEFIYRHPFFLLPITIPMYSYTAMRLVGK